MKKVYFLFCAILGLGFVLDGSVNSKILQKGNETPLEQKSDSLIIWGPSVKLSWNDFNGIPDSTSEYKALTYVNVIYKYDFQEDAINAKIYCVFDKKYSWSKSKDKSSDDLLKHEKVHFDIAEIMARKIRKEISKHVSTNLKTTESFISKVDDKYFFKQMDSLNKRYDEETNHGIIKKIQLEWESKIALELKKLEKYAPTKVVIRRVKN